MNEKKDTRGSKPRSERPEETRGLPLENLALKVTAQYFGEVLLPYMGITEKLSVAMPTEQVELRVIHLFEDFNYQLADREEWLHLESDLVIKPPVWYHVSIYKYLLRRLFIWIFVIQQTREILSVTQPRRPEPSS